MTCYSASPPCEEVQSAWRAAARAYGRELRATRLKQPAWHAACDAFLKVLPDIPEAQIRRDVVYRHRLRGGDPH
jgi:hypothetical protein